MASLGSLPRYTAGLSLLTDRTPATAPVSCAGAVGSRQAPYVGGESHEYTLSETYALYEHMLAVGGGDLGGDLVGTFHRHVRPEVRLGVRAQASFLSQRRCAVLSARSGANRPSRAVASISRSPGLTNGPTRSQIGCPRIAHPWDRAAGLTGRSQRKSFGTPRDEGLMRPGQSAAGRSLCQLGRITAWQFGPQTCRITASLRSTRSS